MSFKLIVGIIQIVFSLSLIVGMVLGFTVINSSAKESIQAGIARMPQDVRTNIDLSLIEKMITGTSIFIGIIGFLFLLQGISNLIKEQPSLEKNVGEEKKVKKETKQEPSNINLKKQEIPDEY